MNKGDEANIFPAYAVLNGDIQGFARMRMSGWLSPSLMSDIRVRNIWINCPRRPQLVSIGGQVRIYMENVESSPVSIGKARLEAPFVVACIRH